MRATKIHHEPIPLNRVSFAELLQIHSFVAQLPTSVSSSAQLMLKRLHSDCMKYDAVDKAQADFTLGKAIRSLCKLNFIQYIWIADMQAVYFWLCSRVSAIAFLVVARID